MYLYCRQTVAGGHQFHARCFAPMPASRRSGDGRRRRLPGVIHRFDELKTAANRYIVEQGVEMRRPSRIQLEVDVAGRSCGRAGWRRRGDCG